MTKRFTTKEMVLVNLLEYFPVQDNSPKPLEITQEGLAEVTGSRQNTISYAVRELLEEALIYEETTRVKGRNQRRKGYYLTEKGIELAKKLKERMANIPVKIFLDGETKEVLLKEVNNYLHTNYNFLEIYCNAKNRVFEAKPVIEREFNAIYLHHMPTPTDFAPMWLDDLYSWRDGTLKVCIIEGEGGSGKTTLVTKFVEKIKKEVSVFYFKIDLWHTPIYFWNALAQFLSSTGEHKLKAYLEASDKLDFKEALSSLRMDFAFLSDVFFVVEDVDLNREIMELVCRLCNEMKDLTSVRMIVTGKPDSCPPEYKKDMSVEKILLEYGECELPLFVELGKRYDLDEGCDVVLDVILESKFTPEEFISLAYASTFRTPVDKMEVITVGEVNKNLFNSLIETPLLSTTVEGDISPHDIVRERIIGRLLHEEQKLLHSLAAEYYDALPAKKINELIEHIYHMGRSTDAEDFVDLLQVYAEDIISSGYHEQLLRELDSIMISFDISGKGGFVELYKAETHLRSGRYDDAVQLYQKLVDHNEDQEILTRVHMGIATAFRQEKRYDEAIDQYERASKSAENLGLSGGSLLGTIYLQWGETLSHKDDHKKAMEYTIKAIQKHSLQKNYPLLTTSYLQAARLEKELGNTQAALDHFKKGLESWKKIEESYLRAHGMHDIGLFYKGIRDLSDAEEFLEDAVEISERFGYTSLKASALITLAECSLEQGDMDKAIITGNKALEIFKYLDRDEDMAYAHALLGQAYMGKNETEEAEDHYNRAVTLYHKLGISYLLGLVYFSMAKLEEKKGNKEGVADYYRKSVLSLMSGGADDLAQQVERMMKTVPISM